jgi:solute carrier family 31 (copper transporter), member 1
MIQMLWNWYTIDACKHPHPLPTQTPLISTGFLSRSWHIHSRGAFIASCLGVILLVMTLELLRRLSKEYDRYLVRAHLYLLSTDKAEASDLLPICSSEASDKPLISQMKKPFRPNVLQQAVRATLLMLQFGLAYLIMLLAMYYNGFVIISIVVGAWLGAFVFGWESIDVRYVYLLV